MAGTHPYCGPAPNPAEWLTRWNFDPVLIGGLALAASLWLRSGATGSREHGCFWSAWGLAVILFVSPLCPLSSALFSVRVVHHALLATAIAPLLALALPRLRPGGGLPGWTAAHVVTLWLWHAPPVYNRALSDDLVFWAMQLSILATSVGFWAALRRSSVPGAVVMLLLATMTMGMLGALITFASAPLYAPHLLSTAAWGLTALEDQQLGGLIMWAPASLAYLLAALFALGRMLGGGERLAPRLD